MAVIERSSLIALVTTPTRLPLACSHEIEPCGTTHSVGWPVTSDGVAATVTVNLSAKHLADPGLVALVSTVLEDHDIAPARLCLEVTESDLVYDREGSASTMRRLKQLGVRLAIDDFGTGYASLDYVRRFSMADVLKIDATFVRGLSHDRHEDRAIVSAAIVLGRTLGFEIIAEGVEDERQRRILVDLGCDKAQGYLFSGAITGPEVAARLGADDCDRNDRAAAADHNTS